MKKRIKMKTSIFVWLLFSLVTLLAACGQKESEETEERAFGIDYSEELSIPLVEQVVCGQECAWAITSIKDDFIYKLAYNDGAAGLEQIEWQQSEGNYYIVNIAERNGTLYAELQNKEEDILVIYKLRADGEWNEVMSIKAEDLNWYIMGSGLFVDDKENVYLVSGGTVTCFGEKGKLLYTYELNGNINFLQQNSDGCVECIAAKPDEIILYELREGKAEEKWVLEVSAEQSYVVRSSEEGTLCLATNEELLFIEAQTGRLMAKLSLVKIGAAAVRAGYYDAEEEILRLYGSGGNGTEGLYYSLLSSRDSSEEQRTELVYGMVGGANADSTSSIWTAITTFNRESKNYYVTIRNYEGWFNLERLHSDMAAGNGPDIIDMTYFEYYESYVKNGYLEDLTPYLERSRYKDDIIWNVLDTYKIDDGLYMLVPQFQLSGILIHPEYEASVEEWNMDTFLDLLEKNCWEMDIFGTQVGNPESLLYYILYGRQEEFVDWRQKTASFEGPEFMDVLALCKEYGEADWSDASEWTYEEHRWNTLCNRTTVAIDFATYLFNIDMYGREYSIYGYPTSYGQVYRIAACADSCAIYAGSQNKEGAWEFIESLLWDSNQKCLGIVNPGLPIRSSILQEVEDESKDQGVKINGEVTKITDGEIAIQEDIIYNGELVGTLINPDIWAVVQEEAASYFAGDKTAAEVAHIIQSRVGIILGE